MPTLDDAPIVSSLTFGEIADDDLIQIYDASDRKAKTITFEQLIDYVCDKTDASEPLP